MSDYPYREPYEEGFSDGKDEAKERIAELETDNRRLSEIEQRRIGEAITQADSIAELREQLADMAGEKATAMKALFVAARERQEFEQQLAELREACEVFAELNVKLEQQLERQEAYYMGDRAELAALREAAQNYYECQDLVSWVQDVEGIKQAAEKALLVALKEKGE